MSLSVVYLNAESKNSKIKQPPNNNYTIREHEFHHVQIFQNAWNYFSTDVNNSEGDYSCQSCANIAKQVVDLKYNLMIANMNLQNANFDWDEYASNPSSPSHFSIQQEQDTALRDKAHFETLIETNEGYFSTAKCRMP